MRDMRVLPSLLLILALGSCASLSEEECLLGDWRGIGFEDGAQGRAPDAIARHREACAEVGVSPDLSLWLAGREEGLRRYCTPANAYRIARAGQSVAPYCTTAEQIAMRPAISRGLAYAETARALAEARDDLATIEAAQEAASEEAEGAFARTAIFARAQVRQLERDLEALSRWP